MKFLCTAGLAWVWNLIGCVAVTAGWLGAAECSPVRYCHGINWFSPCRDMGRTRTTSGLYGRCFLVSAFRTWRISVGSQLLCAWPLIKTRRWREQNSLTFYCNRELGWTGAKLEAKKCLGTFTAGVATAKVRSGCVVRSGLAVISRRKSVPFWYL